MKSKASLLLIVWMLALAACAPAQAIPPLQPSATPAALPVIPEAIPTLGMDSTSEQIQQAMLVSAAKWQSLFMDGAVNSYDPGGNLLDSRHEQVWIDPMAFRFRYLSGPGNQDADSFKVSDGTKIIEMNLVSGDTQTYDMAPTPAQPQYIPPLEPGTVYGNPLWSQMGAPLAQLAFPSDFAQSQGTFKPIGVETVLDRSSLVVEWTRAGSQSPSFRAWLDLQTSVMLKKQGFGKSGGQTLESEMTLTKVVFDVAFDDSLFVTPTELPRFADPNGLVLNPLETGAAVPTGVDVMGDLYFFTLPHQAGQTPQLVRLPGSCVVGLSPCPRLETIQAPFAFNFTLYPLSWSSDGQHAAFSYSDNSTGTPQKVFIFDASANTWTPVAQFPFVDPPFWSPDGTWVAFRAQDGMGGEDIYVVHRDGTELKNLTASGGLPADARPYIMDGWITENISVHSALPGREGTVYLVRAADGAARPLFDTLLTKAVFVPSPDGAYLAYDDYDYNSQKHVLRMTEPDAAHPVDLATFPGGSLYPIVWSPDASRVAFVYYTSYANGDPSADVYLVGRDGLNLTQVYKGVTVGRILFSPDGKYLLVEETTTSTGGHLFRVNLDTLESRILEAPGLSLDTDWYAPSWRP